MYTTISINKSRKKKKERNRRETKNEIIMKRIFAEGFRNVLNSSELFVGKINHQGSCALDKLDRF